jgi:hypothetical protein
MNGSDAILPTLLLRCISERTPHVSVRSELLNARLGGICSFSGTVTSL